ncbi:hypothetical protein [Paracoccus fistulariae]|uniref:DUF202 domain-containing protein n=1 Tax=Paracoccus fistulariae TaxID=658446 RepID=A0ABY7SLM4_9RHOB|nr:hypothetical protein [Paracoccus fistulariae]MDB6182487.1 hypothetical protein [Paracoccus fistulariae]WCR07706.1 hypothetical protein JHX87_02370 [Paracoccus fistulariae]
MNRSDILLEFAKIEHEEARRYENQRERLLGLSFVATGAILAAIYSDVSTTSFDVLLAGIATVLNLFVSVTSLKFYLAFKRRYERYRVLRSEIDKEFGIPSLEELMGKADEIDRGKDRYRLVEGLRIHSIWSTLSWLMAIISLAVLIWLILDLI